MGWFSDILREYPEFLIETERLAVLDAENIKRKKEHTKRQIEGITNPKSPQFIAFKEVLWRQQNGKIDTIIYCASCELAMALPSSPNEKLVCSKCNFIAPFRPEEIERLAQSLETKSLSL